MFLVLQIVAGGLERLAVFRLDVALRDRAGREPGDNSIDLAIQFGGLLGRPRDDQRRSGLVDQDAVDLVHDRVGMPALHEVR